MAAHSVSLAQQEDSQSDAVDLSSEATPGDLIELAEKAANQLQVKADIQLPAEPLATIATMRSLISLRDELRQDIQTVNQQLIASESSTEKQTFLKQIEELSADLSATLKNLEEVAAGADLSTLRGSTEDKVEFKFQQEFFALLEPAIKEMKDMTSHVRQKSQLRDKITFYQGKVPITENAIANLEELLQQADDLELQTVLNDMLNAWHKQKTFLSSELQTAQLQLSKLESDEESLAESSQAYLKQFFANRGRTLGYALLLIIAIMVLSRLSHLFMERMVPGYKGKNRSFRVRLLDLSRRVIATLLIILGPVIVFYRAEDWLLFSVGVLFLLGIGLTLRQAIPRYWQQVQLFLNVGTVREGERLEMDGLPWLVQQINLFTMLENPTAGLSHRLKIDDLVDLRSRPITKNEPWFPCRPGDWVLLNTGERGKVIGISAELIEIVERGGAHRTHTTSDFLNCQPLNLSVNFRIKETIGITYNLQQESVSTIPEQLRLHVEQRLKDEGYESQLLNLSVEFQSASVSSLDLVVIADFKGELADVYNRLRRSIQRYCVEACNEHNWEIPFTQLTLHQAK